MTWHFSRAFQKNWLAQASYTLSWLRGNYSGLFRPETGQLDPNINSPTSTCRASCPTATARCPATGATS